LNFKAKPLARGSLSQPCIRVKRGKSRGTTPNNRRRFDLRDETGRIVMLEDERTRGFEITSNISRFIALMKYYDNKKIRPYLAFSIKSGRRFRIVYTPTRIG
jgi:hypothetical protein